jgi:(2Fe-2S) ferredoxin
MDYYQHHAFFCLNERSNGDACCEQHHATKLFDYAKKKCKEMSLNGKHQVRVNRAGCLDRCEFGPVMVVYPQGIWYQFVDEADLDEIIESHFKNGQPVERLMIHE